MRLADRRRHAKCSPEYRRASRPVHPPGARYRPPVSAHPRRQEDAAQSTWLALCQTPIRSATHDVSRMAGHHDAPILRRGHPPPIPRIPHLGLDRYLRPDGHGTPELADAVAMRHATARLHQAITQLPGRRERHLIHVQFGPANHGYAQISRTMHMPIGSIGPIRSRALRRQRTLLHDLE